MFSNTAIIGLFLIYISMNEVIMGYLPTSDTNLCMMWKYNLKKNVMIWACKTHQGFKEEKKFEVVYSFVLI